MKTYMKTIKFIFIILLTHLNQLFAQGFVNLNFEQGVINTSGAPQFQTYASNAIPGWTAYVAGDPQTYIAYNAISLGAGAVSIHDTNDVYPKIQGVYFILLQSATQATPLGPQSAAIGQTAQIPFAAQSVSFWGLAGGLALSFAGQAVPFAQTGTTANYNIYAADISAFSGQIGELLFTAPFKSSGRIDNIQFSSTAVPEPTTLALALLGATLLVCRRK